ncbi:AAA family ATPase [Shewanella chilikensis]|uniref:AAA family ATPase n=1 Tax=Shewanella chilikensis TaxID=558541 RepID=UPI003B66B54E
MSFEIAIPKEDGSEILKIEKGASVVIVGANGAGKTRLSAFVEEKLGEQAHRIAAHRALSLNPSVAKISEKDARTALKTGWNHKNSTIAHRRGSRWGDNAAVSLLNDFDYLLQTLFAEQTNTSLQTHKSVRAGENEEAKATKFEILTQVWQSLLPHRELHISGDDIMVSISGSTDKYSATDMSDGERAVFYMLGQALVADSNTLLIFDEPELHVHKSIMSKLWDELEALRPDCAFLFITHDIEFACSRVAEKYVISKYAPAPMWEINRIQGDSGFDENTLTLILGSRKPILFVEGNGDSLDRATFRCCYPEWTVIPRGSCEQVIHSVVTMRQNTSLTRVSCSGIVDADDYSNEDKEYLSSLGIKVLPLCEIENIFLQPSVAKAILEHEGFIDSELESKVEGFTSAIIDSVSDKNREDAVIRYCRRRIDRALKKIDLSGASSEQELRASLDREVANLNIEALSDYARNKIQSAIEDRNLTELLSIYDNKGLMAIASSHLRNTRLAEFEHWLIRNLNNHLAPKVIEEIRVTLPAVSAA